MSSKIQGKCIYCGGSELSKQHVLPEWLSGILPADNGNRIRNKSFFNFVYSDYAKDPDQIMISPDIRKEQGNFNSHKIRNVCVKCNNGWMSCLEEKAKPILLALIRNESIILDKDAQNIIAAWSTMTTITNEFTDERTIAIPEWQRKQFFKTGFPPEGWKIWIGWYRGNQWKQRIFHWGGKMVLRKEYNGQIPKECNTQSTTIVLGELLIYCVSSLLPNVNISFNSAITRKLKMVWPIQNDSINWPYRVVINDEEADQIANALLFKYT